MKPRLIVLFLGIVFMCNAGKVLPARTADSSILARVNNLPPNTGAYLTTFACIDRQGGSALSVYHNFATNGPGTRDYCMKWVYAPSRERALYCGANHGSPHKFNDVWEYDLQSNTWILLHKPDSGIVPCHTWWGLAYDRKREQLVWASGGGCGSWVDWHVYEPYSPEKGWGVLSFTNAGPSVIGLGAALEYLEDQDKLLWYHCGWQSPGMRELDPETMAWRIIIPGDSVYHNCPECPQAEQVMVYDSVTQTLIAARGASFHECNITERKWRRTVTDSSININDSRGSLVWDCDKRIALWYGDNSKLLAYDTRNKNLVRLRPEGDTCAGTGMAFYHEALKVMVVYVNRTVPTKIWVYRPPVELPTGSENRDTGKNKAISESVSVSCSGNTIRLACQNSTTNKIEGASLYSIAGRKMADLKFDRKSNTLWTSVVAKDKMLTGVYLLKVKSNTGNHSAVVTLIN
jgi:hypothetical protein